MSRPFRLLIFDWDGTLMDSLATIVDCMRQTALDLGLEPFDEERVRQTVGLGLADTMVALGFAHHQDEWAPIVERYGANWRSTFRHQPRFFAGVPELLETLHGTGYWLAVATGKSRRGLNDDFEKTGTRCLFLASRTADETRSKPHPQMLFELLEELGVADHEALMIGDTTFDLKMANNAGMRSLAVTTGSHNREQLEECAPVACLSSVTHLAEWLETGESR